MKTLRALFVHLLCWIALPATAMQALDDASLEEVTGQDGIAVALELRVNADAAGNPLASLSNCAGVGNPCRLALSFANRAGEWLVIKDWYGVINIDPIYLDAGVRSDAASNPAYFDASKFADGSGNCLVTGNPGACSVADVTSGPALVLSYPGTTLGYNPGTVTSSGYDSMTMSFNLGRLAVEFDGVNPGYLNDANGSFLGATVGDLSGGPAGAAFGGKAYVFGF